MSCLMISVAETIDIHGGAAGEVLELAVDEFGAVAGAHPPGGLAGGAFGFEPGFAHAGGKVEGLGVGEGVFSHTTADNRRDDFPGFFDDHGIALADIFALDFIFVVKGCAAHGGTGNEDRFEFGHGGVSTPVRPSWRLIRRRRVMPCSAANL